MTLAIEAKSKTDRKKLAEALVELADDDPRLHIAFDEESHQTIIGGQNELHLDDTLYALKRKVGLVFDIGAPQVAYRETITKRVDIDYTHKEQNDGTRQFARVKFTVEPSETSKGFEFESKIVGESVPKKYIPGVEKGLNSVIGSGVIAGFPVVNVKVTLTDGAFHEVDSSAVVFEIASRAALREGLQKGGAVLLEPIMKVEVVTPEDYTGPVIGDLNERRGQIQGQDMRGGTVIINAMVPLANMFGLLNTLRSHSEGQASFTATYAYCAPVSQPNDDEPPPAIAAALRA
jgi:elongation factor G